MLGCWVFFWVSFQHLWLSFPTHEWQCWHREHSGNMPPVTRQDSLFSSDLQFYQLKVTVELIPKRCHFLHLGWRALKAQIWQTHEKNCMQQLHIFMIFISLYNSLCLVNKYLKNLGISTQQEGVKFHKQELKWVPNQSWLQHSQYFLPQSSAFPYHPQ